MKEKRNVHLKVQEMCDCYATTDPLKEMCVVADAADKDEAALKWLALAALHGVNFNAKKVTLNRAKDGTVNVTAKYRKADLPSPGADVGAKVIEALREVTHIEADKGKLPLSLGIRESTVDVTVKVEKEKEGETITLEFPESK